MGTIMELSEYNEKPVPYKETGLKDTGKVGFLTALGVLSG